MPHVALSCVKSKAASPKHVLLAESLLLGQKARQNPSLLLDAQGWS